MTGLVRVEARRFRYRAAIRWLALLSVVAALAVVAGVVASVRPPSAEAVASAEQQVALAQEDWEENGDQYVADCRSGEEQERATNPDADWGCDSIEPRLEQYIPVQPTFADHARGWLSGATVLVLLLAFASGVTFVTAELATGALGTWLTFVPQRGRVYASKVVVAGVGVLVPAAAALAVTVAGSWAAAALQDTVGDVTAETWRALGDQAARTLAAAAVLGAVGAALGFLLRSAAAALGVGIGWMLLVDGVLAGILPALQPWTLRLSLEAWLQAGTTYWLPEACPPLDGVPQAGACTGERTLSMLHGGVLLAVVAAVLVALGAVVLRRRDVD
ncbi:ABC transporter permease subunit [Cellulomonas sp. C5510]|uniref:ABC transporter permease subunit n=1 Tax=Cellulomonas sp. C5510 TaxID=2871170 RepID=UPI001C975C1E|nr:ABC transporter permease subunit [Cellulomonas sp. C5510]QZN86549.1 ABC transporter permease subunit [Cellulomonas sp. C5510]